MTHVPTTLTDAAMWRPKVSVIVPAYNASETLAESINSLLHQTLKEIEIVIVNDSSTDRTADLINGFADNHDNIIPVHLSENLGVHEARLTGLKSSSAPWIGFLDADDYARSSMFETLVETAERDNSDIVICGSDRVTREHKVISSKICFSKYEVIDNNIFSRFCDFEFGTGPLWNKLFRREVIEPWFDLHFPWRQSLNEDLLLNIGCFFYAKRISLIKEVLHEYSFRGDSVTSSIDSERAYVETFRAFALAIHFYKHLGENALFEILKMFREQMGWGDYLINDVSGLTRYKEHLDEAVKLLIQDCPFVLGMLPARKPVGFVSGSVALKSIGRSLKKRFFKFNI